MAPTERRELGIRVVAAPDGDNNEAYIPEIPATILTKGKSDYEKENQSRLVGKTNCPPQALAI